MFTFSTYLLQIRTSPASFLRYDFLPILILKSFGSLIPLHNSKRYIQVPSSNPVTKCYTTVALNRDLSMVAPSVKNSQCPKVAAGFYN